MKAALVFHQKRRAIFRPGPAPVVETRRRYVSMAEPFLNLGDIGLMGECIRRRRSTKRIDAQPVYFSVNTCFFTVFGKDIAIDRTGIEVDAIDGIAKHCMSLAEIVKER